MWQDDRVMNAGRPAAGWVVVALIALVASACSGSGGDPTGTPPPATATASSTIVQPTASVEPTPVDSATPAPTATPGMPRPTLTVDPASGPVGSVVHLVGHGFPAPVDIDFECQGVVDESGTLVGAGWAPVTGEGSGSDFEIDWVVPAELMAQQQRGGGPTVGGVRCTFTSHPPYIGVAFAITPRRAEGGGP
jgi:hypothetical protein